MHNLIQNIKGGSSELETEDIYKLIDLFFKQKNVMYMQSYNSFDKFIEDDLRNFLLGNNNIFYESYGKTKVYTHKFVHSDIAVKPPMDDNDENIITPYDARTKRMTYSVKVVSTVTQVLEIKDIDTGEITTQVIGEPEKDVPIARIPNMVNSRFCTNNLFKELNKYECRFDPGSYFIISGSEKASEKVLINTERMIENKPLVFSKRDGTSTLYSVQVNCKSYLTDIKQTVIIKMAKNNTMGIQVHLFSDEIPVFILIRALGIESDYDIINYISLDTGDTDMINIITQSLEACKDENGNKILTQEQAITYLINHIKVARRIKYNETDKDIKTREKKLHLNELLTNSFLPHISGDHFVKGYYLCYMIRKLLLCALKRVDIDDRDSLINKRIDLPGTLLFELFKQAYKKMLNECTKFFQKRNQSDEKPINIINQIKPNTIEQALKTGLLTGSWDKKKGVSQMLQRLTYKQTVSLLRRVNSPATDASTNKLTSPRHLHPTQVGFLCVTGDTLITMFDGSKKMVKHLELNDIVLSINKDTLQVEATRINNYFHKMPLHLYKITTSSGKYLKATSDHPILVNINDKVEWVNTKDLRVGDSLYIRNNNGNKYDIINESIIAIENIEPEIVYDFETLSPNHSFFANDFVVSNCHIETPEGHQVGLVKNISVGANITIMLPSQSNMIKGLISNMLMDIRDITPTIIKHYTQVFLNGELLGLTREPRKLYNYLKKLKYEDKIDPHTGIIHEIKNEIECRELYIYCDSGRCYRPIFRVEDNKLLYTKDISNLILIDDDGINNPALITNWIDLMARFPGVIEYIDQHEQYNSLLAMFPNEVEQARQKMENSIEIVSKMNIDNNNIINRYDDTFYVKYTHCEIHPTLHFGIVANGITFCSSNQGPRNIFQYSQAKQAMSIYLTSYRHRLDISYILYHPYSPIVYCRMSKYTNNDQLPSGENAIVALLCYSGFNQEDSIIFNQSALDRGMFRSMNLTKEVTEIQKNQSTSQDDIFVKPDPNTVIGMKQASYDKLNELGYVPEETEVQKGDIILGKITPIQPIGDGGKTFKDSSAPYKYILPGVVDKVWTKIFTNEGYEIRMARIRSERKPRIGDKLCCYTPDHQILTINGWIDIANITPSTYVASLASNQTLVYTNPLAIQKFDYNGSIYTFNKDGYSLRVTPNHRMYVKLFDSYTVKQARNIYGLRYNLTSSIKNYNPFNKSKYFSADWKYFINGNCKIDLKSLINFVVDFTFNISKIDPNIYIKYFNSIFENYNQIPKWCKYLNMELSLYFINKMKELKVDMSRFPQFEDDINQIMLHSNMESNIVNINDNIGELFSSNIMNFNNEETEVIGIHANQDDKYEHYQGLVYCCTVSDQGVIFIRRKTETQKYKGFWCGNSAHGQKGIIGLTLPQADMPFTKNGITPDLIINPNGIPSRMTVGQLIECLVAKVSALRGHVTDGSPFQSIDLEKVKDVLESLGYNRNGYEYLYNGMTGRKLKSMIFIGPTYYQRLKHMVSDKIHARARGPRTILTRQPPEGRSRDGGLRFGEMERDSIIGHGCAKFLKERMLDTADPYTTRVCTKCGLFAAREANKNNKSYPTNNDLYRCKACKNNTHIAKIRIPYAFKLLIQELVAMNIAPRIRIKDSEYI